MLSTEDASKMLDEMKRYDEASQPTPQQESPKAPDTATPAEKGTTKEDGKGSETAGSEPTTTTPDKAGKEDHPADGKNPPKRKKDYTQQERFDYAFRREKERAERLISAKDARIKELEGKLKREKGLTIDDFNGDQKAFDDYRIEQKISAHEVERLKGEKDGESRAIAEQESGIVHKRRIDACFGDDAERRQRYSQLLERNANKFLDYLGRVDPQETVLQYLDDCENEPLVTEILMTKPDVLAKVLAPKNPYLRMIELNKLGNFVQMRRKFSAANASAKIKSPSAMPVIGSQVHSEPPADSSVRDSKYWNDYLTKHRGRGW